MKNKLILCAAVFTSLVGCGDNSVPYELGKEYIYCQHSLYRIPKGKYHDYTKEIYMFSPVANFNGDDHIFFIYQDERRRPTVGHLRPGEETVLGYVEDDWYTSFDNSHHTFVIGVDEKGYL
ncbi:MAG: uncharacterized protein A8A55_3089, partial [Amphiamblys sp. WSBS2006]